VTIETNNAPQAFRFVPTDYPPAQTPSAGSAYQFRLLHLIRTLLRALPPFYSYYYPYWGYPYLRPSFSFSLATLATTTVAAILGYYGHGMPQAVPYRGGMIVTPLTVGTPLNRVDASGHDTAVVNVVVGETFLPLQTR
jgi:hypothetical protein